jgi:ABC-type nitrate/sulfonate/bicarbonate transport system permease component
MLLLWFLATNVWHVSSILLPRPLDVWYQLIDVVRSGEFIRDLRVTFGELAAAFAFATILGVSAGYFVSRSSYLIKVFEPLFAAIYAIPIILFLPLYVMIWGLGPASKIALGATISFFPIVLSTIVGFGNVDRTLAAAARSMGANNTQMFRHVLLPAALPVMLAGLRMGFTVALLSVIGSETIASLAGLGHRIVNLAESMEMARMFAYIVFVVAIVAFLNWALSAFEAYGRWR